MRVPSESDTLNLKTGYVWIGVEGIFLTIILDTLLSPGSALYIILVFNMVSDLCHVVWVCFRVENPSRENMTNCNLGWFSRSDLSPHHTETRHNLFCRVIAYSMSCFCMVGEMWNHTVFQVCIHLSKSVNE